MPKNNFQRFGHIRGIKVTEANESQRQFWNDKPGANWVRFYRDLDIMHHSVLEKLLDCAAPEAGETVIDIGCGAGTSSFALAELVGPSGAVSGYDISEPLLTKAEERRAEKGVSNVSFHLADAQTAGFNGSADLIVSRFGVMFFDDPEAAFANLHSALRPGGRIVFITWAASEFNPWFSLARKIAVQHFGDLPDGDPDAPGPMSLRDIDRGVSFLKAGGFADPVGEAVDLTLDHPDGWPALRQLVPHIGPVGRFLRDCEVTQEQRAALFDDLDKAFSEFVTDAGISVPARINVFSALA